MGLFFLVLQHNDWEGPGNFFITAAQQLHVRYTFVNLCREPIPSLSPYDGLIVLGTAKQSYNLMLCPFLEKEKQVIHQSILDDRPYLGINLGHLLLAEVLGAKTGPNFIPSAGFTTGYLTCSGRQHPAFAGFPRATPFFKWHNESVQEPLPKQLSVLATSKICQVEAIAANMRPHILGLQFDNHCASMNEIKQRMEHDSTWLTKMFKKNFDADSILQTAKELEDKLAGQFYLLLKNYIKLLR